MPLSDHIYIYLTIVTSFVFICIALSVSVSLSLRALRSHILIEEEGGDGGSGTNDGGMYHITVPHSLSYGAKHSTRNTLCSYTRHAYICYKDSALCVVAWCGHLAVSFRHRY